MLSNFFEQYAHNTTPGPYHAPGSDLGEDSRSETSTRAIAFYLPQFHAIPENNEWWGPGFTEWTNVTRAVPRYEGHRQPRLPADLGFYDLSRVDTLHRQAELAARAGIQGFCLHDYWFGGRKILETPLQLLLTHHDLDLGFCLSWANENWTRRWDGAEHDILLGQDYNEGNWDGYARSILRAVTDPRYLTVNGRPLVLVYRPAEIPDAERVFDSWRALFVREGLPNPYLVMAQTFGDSDPRPYGLDAAAGFPPHNIDAPNLRRIVRRFDRRFAGRASSYADLARQTEDRWKSATYTLFPGVAPGWDNEARKPNKGSGFFGATPDRYHDWLVNAIERAACNRTTDEKIVFINAWNEWAEGAVLEPDRYYGHAFLIETRRALLEHGRGEVRRGGPEEGRFVEPHLSRTRTAALSQLRRASDAARRVSR